MRSLNLRPNPLPNLSVDIPLRLDVFIISEKHVLIQGVHLLFARQEEGSI